MKTPNQKQSVTPRMAPEKAKYFSWRDGWINREDRDAWFDEDREKRTALGITDADGEAWREHRDSGIDF